MTSMHKLAILISAAACGTGIANAAFTYPGCKDVVAADLKVVPIVTRATDKIEEPMKMAFDLLAAPGEDAKGKVDVYFTERMGNLRKSDSKTSTVKTLGTLTLTVDQGNSSDGLLGIALDPAFKTNHNIFMYYSSIGATVKEWRVSRFTLNAANDKLDPANEVVVLRVPIHGGSKHPGGAIQFDAYGDLWISVGNDYYNGDFPVWSSANTNDLRGKILRIHPTADGKYSIPAGNLFASGTALTKPEIYIMGNRNPYTITLEPVKRWLLWGDVGPDGTDMDGKVMNATGATEKTEEYDLAQAPGNYGYPFWAGDHMTKSGMNAAAPVIPAETNWNGYTPGMTNLPAAVAPIYAYHKSCAITGPLVRFDGALKSSIKLPPHFDKHWMVTDFNGANQKITVFSLDAAGKAITAEEALPGVALHGPLDMQQGPDGALYVSNYGGVWRNVEANTGIVRVEYTGDCAVSTVDRRGEANLAPKVSFSKTAGFAVMVGTTSRFDLVVRDLRGRPLVSKSAQGAAPVSLDEIKQPGVYFLTVRSPEGDQVVKFAKD